MRFRKKDNHVSVHAITGTYVVMLGLDIDPEQAKGLLGFAIHRTDPKEGEAYWLQGMRTFEASYPNPPQGAQVTTQEHPVQDFLWSDFTAKPGRSYTYRVVPVYGKPKNLTYGDGVEVEVETEKEKGAKHTVYFNRAVIGSQAYARKFGKAPDKLTGAKRKEAYEWLSRGLMEAIEAFLGEAKDATFGIRAAVYEFSEERAGAAFGKALADCGDVRIIYDARIPPSDKGSEASRVAAAEALLAAHGLTGVAIPRRANANYIAHNKFIVLLKNKKPVAVWTGSTNFTESGIFGQANVGHLVRDAKVAAAYLAYWERLSADPESDDLKSANAAATPTLATTPPETGTTTIFSPRGGVKQLEWYGAELEAATQLSCFTAAFGVNAIFQEGYKKDQDYLRYVFLEKWGVTKESAEATEAALGLDPDVQVAVGATIKDQVLYTWLKELPNSLSKMVKYVHTKFMLVDPLHDTDPVVITGSANFSKASTTDNDENMLIIRGDKRVADIYLGEFMRLWRHHRFRDIVTKVNAETGELSHNYLEPSDKWAKPFLKKGTVKNKRRAAFA